MPSQRFKWCPLGQACCIIFIHSPQVNFQSFFFVKLPFFINFICSHFFKRIWMNFQAVLLSHCKRCHGQRCSSDEEVLSRSHKEELAGSWTNLARHSLSLALVFLSFSSTGLSAQNTEEKPLPLKQRKEGRLFNQPSNPGWSGSPLKQRLPASCFIAETV